MTLRRKQTNLGETKNLQVYTTPDKYRRYKRAAKSEGISLSAMGVRALDFYLVAQEIGRKAMRDAVETDRIQLAE